MRPDDLYENLRRDRADLLVDDGAVALDDESLRRAIEAPIDGRSARSIGTDGGERIAEAGEKTARIVRLVLVVDAEKPDAVIPSEFEKLRVLLAAWRAPGREEVDDRHLSFSQICIAEPRDSVAACDEIVDGRESEFRNRLQEQRRGQLAWLSGEELKAEDDAQRREDRNRQDRQPSCRAGRDGFFHGSHGLPVVPQLKAARFERLQPPAGADAF